MRRRRCRPHHTARPPHGLLNAIAEPLLPPLLEAMRINIQLEVEPGEVPLATELLGVLRRAERWPARSAADGYITNLTLRPAQRAAACRSDAGASLANPLCTPRPVSAQAAYRSCHRKDGGSRRWHGRHRQHCLPRALAAAARRRLAALHARQQRALGVHAARAQRCCCRTAACSLRRAGGDRGGAAGGAARRALPAWHAAPTDDARAGAAERAGRTPRAGASW